MSLAGKDRGCTPFFYGGSVEGPVGSGPDTFEPFSPQGASGEGSARGAVRGGSAGGSGGGAV